MSNTKTLHFRFTPIQSFIAQARRTRDLWAGSYLLAWLSGQAMAAILKDNGEILMPCVEGDALISAIQNPKQASDLAKSVGTLPTCFMARIPEQQDPAIYAQAIQDKWLALAEAVRIKIDPKGTEIDVNFWNRQIDHHWDFHWVIGETLSLLDSRKNMRLPKQTEECGEKCTVCGERQELFDSSVERQRLSKTKETPYFPPDRKASQAWWGKLELNDLDLRENERLCAVCLTKRLFPFVAQQVLGWPVDRFYPSTAYLSAIDWLETVLEKAKTDQAVCDTANELTKIADIELRIHNSEHNTRIYGLSENLKTSGVCETFLDLDGDVFYLSGIASDQLQKRGGNQNLSPAEKQKLSDALIKLQKAAGSSATPFYALLLMDGDGMGKLFDAHDQKTQKALSTALSEFSGQVPDIVKRLNGRLVYAGGDDVFALLPVSTAIRCARECRKAYQQAFAGFPDEIKQAATISAAVQFAHQNTALSVVVHDAHRLLDDIAKDRTGRDALACRVWKPGGIVLTWSQPWELQDTAAKTDAVQLLEDVRKDFHPDSQNDRFSSKFLHKLPDFFELIQNSGAFSEAEIHDLLLVEYLANREHGRNPEDLDKETLRQQAKERLERLLLLSRIIEDQKISYKKGAYNADAGLLVRFLVQKEV